MSPWSRMILRRCSAGMACLPVSMILPLPFLSPGNLLDENARHLRAFASSCSCDMAGGSCWTVGVVGDQGETGGGGGGRRDKSSVNVAEVQDDSTDDREGQLTGSVDVQAAKTDLVGRGAGDRGATRASVLGEEPRRRS